MVSIFDAPPSPSVLVRKMLSHLGIWRVNVAPAHVLLEIFPTPIQRFEQSQESEILNFFGHNP